MGKGALSGYTCVRYLFFAFNVLFWLLGCTILGIGIWLHVAKGEFAPVMPNFHYFSAAALCMAAGTIMLMVGFFGCCGAIMEHQCLLVTYFLLVIVIFVMEIIAGILAFVYIDEVERMARKELILGIAEGYPAADSSEQSGLRTAWNNIQQQMQCCGVSNYSDWFESRAWQGKDYVPDSCCTVMTTGCGKQNNPQLWFKTACLEKVKYWLTQHLYVIGVAALAIGVLQVLGMVASMTLFCCLRTNKHM